MSQELLSPPLPFPSLSRHSQDQCSSLRSCAEAVQQSQKLQRGTAPSRLGTKAFWYEHHASWPGCDLLSDVQHTQHTGHCSRHAANDTDDRCPAALTLDRCQCGWAGSTIQQACIPWGPRQDLSASSLSRGKDISVGCAEEAASDQKQWPETMACNRLRGIWLGRRSRPAARRGR